jgi:hypothetical protein
VRRFPGIRETLDVNFPDLMGKILSRRGCWLLIERSTSPYFGHAAQNSDEVFLTNTANSGRAALGVGNTLRCARQTGFRVVDLRLPMSAVILWRQG